MDKTKTEEERDQNVDRKLLIVNMEPKGTKKQSGQQEARKVPKNGRYRNRSPKIDQILSKYELKYTL